MKTTNTRYLYYYHGIASTDLNGSFSDSISINSFNDIILRVDSNDNNNNSYVRFMDNTYRDHCDYLLCNFVINSLL